MNFSSQLLSRISARGHLRFGRLVSPPVLLGTEKREMSHVLALPREAVQDLAIFQALWGLWSSLETLEMIMELSGASGAHSGVLWGSLESPELIFLKSLEHVGAHSGTLWSGWSSF